MLRNKWLGHLMIIFTQVVLGVNIPITRDLLLNYLSPMGYIGVRAVGAALFFWTIQRNPAGIHCIHTGEECGSKTPTLFF